MCICAARVAHIFLGSPQYGNRKLGSALVGGICVYVPEWGDQSLHPTTRVSVLVPVPNPYAWPLRLNNTTGFTPKPWILERGDLLTISEKVNQSYTSLRPVTLSEDGIRTRARSAVDTQTCA